MSAAVHNMFHLGLPLAEKILRPILVYLFLIAGLRLAGKREMAQLNPFDLVVLLTLSNTVQNAIIGEDNSVTGGVIGAATLLLVNHVVVRFLFKHERIDQLIEGKATVIIENGALKHDQCERELITRTEIEVAAHRQGFGSLDEIETAVLDPSGNIVFTARTPVPDETRHQDIMRELHRIAGLVAAKA